MKLINWFLNFIRSFWSKKEPKQLCNSTPAETPPITPRIFKIHLSPPSSGRVVFQTESFERCCLCGSVINANDPIALYQEPNKERTWNAAYIEIENKKNYLGCLGWDCCVSGGFFSGYLREDGFVEMAFGTSNVLEEVMRTGKPIYIDLS